MLVSINYVSTYTLGPFAFHNYQLVDSEYTKKISIQVNVDDSVQDIHRTVSNGILNFILNEYRHTKYCPFANIKQLFANRGFHYSDDVIRKTEFYKNHKKVMDKILTPISITPTNNYSSTVTFPSFTYSGSTITATTTVTVPYPAQYIYLNVTTGTRAQ